jgi:DNA-directed RNA polymerase subunit RPC12/RpoP
MLGIWHAFCSIIVGCAVACEPTQGWNIIGGVMNIVCSQCNATYSLAEPKVPEKRAVAQCKKCGGRIVIEPGSNRFSAAPLETATDVGQPMAKAGGTAVSGNSHPRELLADYPELVDFAPSAYKFRDIFSRNKKDSFKSRRNRFKIKILQSVKSVLDHVLKDGECVRHIAFGTAYYPMEIFLGNGWLTMLYNRYALVATDHRLIMINTNHRMTKPTHYLFQLPYEEIKKVRRGLFRTNITLERKKGKRRVFTGMKSYLSAELQHFLQGNIDPAMPLNENTPSWEHLCPACVEPLPAKLEACSQCGTAFKTPPKAMLRSLILPGWGDIYLGHRVLGLLELTGSLMVWVFVVLLLASGEFLTGAFLLLICNGMDALLTLHMARKGYIPEKQQQRMPLQAAHSPA